ncbi:MAG TPA: TetR/AcrR family transcriptional regulator [Microlunatus sp.]|nr:TetR/AcrR family transcriptional regulator [Microlunatus sp.]
MTTSAPLTARAVARRELTAAIVGSARRQLAEVGPAQLSVRAVARDLGMASSAVYRYFPSRDDLLTELLVIIYGELADHLEAADAACARDDLAGRWRALGTGLRDWARGAPHEYAFLYGSPVPGYAAPEATIAPSARVTGVLLTLAGDLNADGPRTESFADFRERAGLDLSDETILRAVTAWGGLLGAISLELFGHLHRAVTDYDAHFALVLDRLDPTRS